MAFYTRKMDWWDIFQRYVRKSQETNFYHNKYKGNCQKIQPLGINSTQLITVITDIIDKVTI